MTTAPTPDSLSADLRRLEEIVRQLEADDTGLDGALTLFEEGVTRLRASRDRLTEADAGVQTVTDLDEGARPGCRRTRRRPRSCWRRRAPSPTSGSARSRTGFAGA